MEEKKLSNAVRKFITLADGRQIEIETGKLAKQADGSVVVKMGDTMLLGTVVAAKVLFQHNFHPFSRKNTIFPINLLFLDAKLKIIVNYEL